jgi:hypothetical protein
VGKAQLLTYKYVNLSLELIEQPFPNLTWHHLSSNSISFHDLICSTATRPRQHHLSPPSPGCAWLPRLTVSVIPRALTLSYSTAQPHLQCFNPALTRAHSTPLANTLCIYPICLPGLCTSPEPSPGFYTGLELGPGPRIKPNSSDLA